MSSMATSSSDSAITHQKSTVTGFIDFLEKYPVPHFEKEGRPR